MNIIQNIRSSKCFTLFRLYIILFIISIFTRCYEMYTNSIYDIDHIELVLRSIIVIIIGYIIYYISRFCNKIWSWIALVIGINLLNFRLEKYIVNKYRSYNLDTNVQT